LTVKPDYVSVLKPLRAIYELYVFDFSEQGAFITKEAAFCVLAEKVENSMLDK
jgi:hypothetical protein